MKANCIELILVSTEAEKCRVWSEGIGVVGAFLSSSKLDVVFEDFSVVKENDAVL